MPFPVAADQPSSAFNLDKFFHELPIAAIEEILDRLAVGVAT
jgi:hypothetical protein